LGKPILYLCVILAHIIQTSDMNRFFSPLLLVLAFASQSFAQYEAASPKDKWEVGLHLGHAMISGDLDYTPGFGGGLHLRKAIDHVFSVRGDAQYMVANSTWNRTGIRGDGVTGAAMTHMSGSLQLVITLNNLIWRSKQVRGYNLYVFGGAGGGMNKVDVDYAPSFTNRDYKNEFVGQVDGGVGASLRLNPKMNLSLEHKIVSIRTGSRPDLLDGVSRYPSGFPELTQFADMIHYTNVRLNINVGKADKSEPLYWVNPMATILDRVGELEKRPVFDLTDTDGDGVIDMVDQEKTTPAGSPVDTRGVTLDSDADGVPNYKDKEPFSPIGFKIDGQGIAQLPKTPAPLTETDVNRLIDGKLAGYTPSKGGATVVGSSVSDWFLPMIHFDLDRYNVKTSEYAALKNVATVMKNNPGVNIVVTGYTDKTAGNSYNQALSYNRANAAIEHLVSVYGIDRSRLILNYGGEDKNLVPTGGQTIMNRRVEFAVATTESNMSRPAGRAGRGNSGGRSGF
jgi:OmpA-OmpF porin, OOP family